MKKKKNEKKQSKRLNKKTLITILVIILLLLVVYIALKVEDRNRITKKKMGENTVYDLKSTTLHKLKADGIKVTDINIEKTKDLLYFTINIENNTNKKIHGFDFGVEILSAKNERVSILYYHKDDTINANGTYTLTGTANINETTAEIDHAKLLYFHAKEEE